MPRLTRWHLKSAMVFLALGLALGVLRAAAGAHVPGVPVRLLATYPLFVHLLVVGWLTQMIFGVAYWMFPIHSRERPYLSPGLGWTAFALLQVGLALRVVAELVPALAGAGSGPAVPPGAFWLSAGAQWLAGLGFVANTWPRVKVR